MTATVFAILLLSLMASCTLLGWLLKHRATLAFIKAYTAANHRLFVDAENSRKTAQGMADKVLAYKEETRKLKLELSALKKRIAYYEN